MTPFGPCATQAPNNSVALLCLIAGERLSDWLRGLGTRFLGCLEEPKSNVESASCGDVDKMPGQELPRLAKENKRTTESPIVATPLLYVAVN